MEIERDRRIVQAWHHQDWPNGHFSQVTLTLTPVYEGRGVRLSLEHTGIPRDAADHISNEWQANYWGRLAEHLRARKLAPVRKFLEEFKNHANIDVVDETWTADSILHVPGMTLPRGRGAQKSVGRKIFAAFGNVHVEVNDTIVEGDRVVERHTATAVHQGRVHGNTGERENGFLDRKSHLSNCRRKNRGNLVGGQFSRSVAADRSSSGNGCGMKPEESTIAKK